MLKLSSPQLLRLRQQYLNLLAIIMLLSNVAGLLLIAINNSQIGTSEPSGLIAVFISMGMSLVWLWLLRGNRVEIAAFGLLLTLLGGYLALTYDVVPIAGTLILITAALFLRRPLFFTVVALIFLRLLFDLNAALAAPGGDIPLVTVLLQIMTFAIIAAVARTITNSLLSSAESANRIAVAISTATNTGRLIGQYNDAQDMMNFAINTIREKYGFYHVQVFLLNESGDQAELRASTGDVGYQLLSRRHQLTVGSQSVVGQAVLRGVPVLVANTEDEVVFFRNELLPNTHAEFTIPLKDRSKVIGALDIQSTVPFSFTDVDRQALEVIAEALSTSLRDRRLGAEQSVLSAENQRLAKEVTTLQRDNDRLNREVTQGQWSEYLTEHTELTGITLQGDDMVPEAQWTPNLAQARRGGAAVTTSDVIAVPVVLRGEVIGAIEVDPGRATPTETVEIAQAVAQRLAVSLESARLYEETRQSAYQEQQINEIAARFGTTGTIDELLRIALVEVGATLGAKGGAIRLGRVQNGAVES